MPCVASARSPEQSLHEGFLLHVRTQRSRTHKSRRRRRRRVSQRCVLYHKIVQFGLHYPGQMYGRLIGAAQATLRTGPGTHTAARACRYARHGRHAGRAAAAVGGQPWCVRNAAQRPRVLLCQALQERRKNTTVCADRVPVLITTLCAARQAWREHPRACRIHAARSRGSSQKCKKGARPLVF